MHLYHCFFCPVLYVQSIGYNVLYNWESLYKGRTIPKVSSMWTDEKIKLYYYCDLDCKC